MPWQKNMKESGFQHHITVDKFSAKKGVQMRKTSFLSCAEMHVKMNHVERGKNENLLEDKSCFTFAWHMRFQRTARYA